MAHLRTGSVRFRVTGLATVIVAGLLILGAGALVIVQHITLTNGLDANLTQRADSLESQFDLTGLPTALPGADDDAATQLVDASGRPVVWSSNIDGAAPLAPDPGITTTIEQRSLPVAENDAFRVLSLRVDINGARFVLHVAAASDDVSDSVRHLLAFSLAVAVPLALGALAAVVWWLVGRALGSVEAIRAEVASIRSDELHRRVPVPEDDDEIGALARTMNDMLARVERGVARQQAFAADASHELRSPLTRMRSEIEVELATGANPDSATLRSVLEEASEMEHLLSDLLYLARSDAGDQPTRATTLDLDDVVLEEIGRRRGSERITIDASSVSAAQVWGDPIQLARAVRNLLDNAVRHARHTVTLSLTESGAEAILVVADDGPGIPADQAERIFERFARIDEGRTRRERRYRPRIVHHHRHRCPSRGNGSCGPNGARRCSFRGAAAPRRSTSGLIRGHLSPGRRHRASTQEKGSFGSGSGPIRPVRLHQSCR